MGAIIPFPCRRRIGKARLVAAKQLASSDNVGRAYWNQTRKFLQTSMARQGIDAQAIERELADFRETVVDELQRQSLAMPDPRYAQGEGDCA